MIVAAIDVGSNAARLLINEVVEDEKKAPEFIKLNLLRIPLRLGIDVFSKGKIGAEREKLTLETMAIFSQMMKIYKVEHYRACATSAMRDASNSEDIRGKIKKESGISIEIISGDEEASLVFENHIAETMDPKSSYLYIDVGGGSTEITYFENGKMRFEKSFNIGTIRLLNGLVTKEHWKEMHDSITKNITGEKEISAIGSGGNINKIFSMSKTKDGKPMATSYLKKYYNELNVLSVKERMQQYNIREDRADVIVPALLIFNNVMSWAKINKIFVPKISVADGLVKSIYAEVKAKAGF